MPSPDLTELTEREREILDILFARGRARAAEVLAELRASLERADISGWPPGWAVSDRPADLWAVDGDVAYPLAPTSLPGRWIAVTCLRR